MSDDKCALCSQGEKIEGYMWGFKFLPVTACTRCDGCDGDWNFFQERFFDLCWLLHTGPYPIELKKKD